MIALPGGRVRTALFLVVIVAGLVAVGISATVRGDAMSEHDTPRGTLPEVPPIDAAAPAAVETAAFAFG